jgi:hypothetical protein
MLPHGRPERYGDGAGGSGGLVSATSCRFRILANRTAAGTPLITTSNPSAIPARAASPAAPDAAARPADPTYA